MNSDHFIDLPEPAKPLWEAIQAARHATVLETTGFIMTTRTTVLPAPVDIETPDSVIQEWLDNWNKSNVSPITLEDLDDITYDFIYRAADRAANLELHKCLFYLGTVDAKQQEDLESALLAYRRPKQQDDLDQIRTELLKEIEDLKDYMMTKIIKLKNKIPQKNTNM